MRRDEIENDFCSRPSKLNDEIKILWDCFSSIEINLDSGMKNFDFVELDEHIDNIEFICNDIKQDLLTKEQDEQITSIEEFCSRQHIKVQEEIANETKELKINDLKNALRELGVEI